VSAFARVVFDTITLVSAALRVGSVPHLALGRAYMDGEICASAATLGELEQVLLRPKFERYQTADVRQAFADIFRRRAVLFSVPDQDELKVNPPCRDAKDNKFLALILACDADALISSDADLLVLHPWQDIPILTPAQFLK
jgi:putative PIN family toxin of toxin-antitoxin system